MTPTPTITEKLAEALRDLRSASISRPSCQLHAAARCCCFSCAYERSAEALAAYRQHTEAQAAPVGGDLNMADMRQPAVEGPAGVTHCSVGSLTAAQPLVGTPMVKVQISSTPPPVEQAAQPVALSDDELRAMWRKAGGSFHGPNVETGTMPESVLLPFLRALHPQRGSEPLTLSAIEALWVEHGLDECDPEGFVRLIERAHGIPSSNGEQA
jgi:hypothetical protein